MFYYTRILGGKGLGGGVATRKVDSVDQGSVGNSGQQDDSARSDGEMAIVCPQLAREIGSLGSRRDRRNAWRNVLSWCGLSDSNQLFSTIRVKGGHWDAVPW